MAGKIKNVVDTQFTSKGAAKTAADYNKVEKAGDGIGRSQTRMGQASVGAGRGFAAQSQGLGGIVGAYAGAAATIFALEAAFTALSKAAEAETIVKGTQTLALEIGQNGNKILASIQKITQSQLTLAESASSANIALAAGFNTSQIENLTTVSIKASRALGRNLTDAMQRVIRGSAKLEPELLDELGIFTRIIPATNAYAAKLGVSATALTNFEKRQAFVNAVIEEGNQKFSAIDTTSGSTQKSLEQLQTRLSNLATEMTQMLAGVLTPFANFFGGDMGNSVLLFGSIIGLVFHKATQLVSSFVTSSLSSMSSWADGLASKAAEAKGSFSVIAEGSASLEKAMLARKAGGGDYKGKTASFAKDLTRDEASAAASARTRLLENKNLTLEQIKTDRAAMIVARDKLKVTRQGSAALDDANHAIATYDKALETSGKKAKAYIWLSEKLTKTANGLAVAFSALGKIMNTVFFAFGAMQLIGQIFDVDILGTIKNWFVDMSQNADNFKTGYTGAFAAAAGGANTLTDNLKRLGATDKELENVDKTITAIQKSIKNAATESEATKETVKTGFWASLFQGGPQLVGARKKAEVETSYTREQVEAIKLEEVTKRIATAKDKLTGASYLQAEALQREILLLTAYKDAIPSEYIANFIGSLTRATGVNSEFVVGMLKNGDLIKETGDAIEILGLTIDKMTDGSYSFASLSKSIQELLMATTTFSKTFDDASSSFDRGATNADKLSARLSGMRDQYENIKKAMAGVVGTRRAQDMLDALDILNDKIEKTADNLERLKAAENILNNVNKTFGSFIAAADNFSMSGLIDENGKLADSAEEAKINQVALLTAIYKSTNAASLAAKARRSTSNKDDAELQTLREAHSAALKAQFGNMMNLYQEVTKLLKVEKQRTVELQAQLQLLGMQNSIAQKQAQHALTQARSTAGIAKQEQSLALGKANLANMQAANNARIKDLQNANALLDIEGQIAVAKSSGGGNAEAAKAQLEATKKQLELLKAEASLKNMSRDPFYSKKEKDDKQLANIELERRILKENYENQIKAIKASGAGNAAALAEQEKQAVRNKEVIQQQIISKAAENIKERALFDEETKLLTTKIQADIDKLAMDKEILNANFELETQKITNAKAIQDAQNQTLLAQLQGYDSLRISMNTFLDAVRGFGTIIADFLRASGMADATGDIENSIKNIPAKIESTIIDLTATINSNIGTQDKIFTEQKNSLKTILDLNLKKFGVEQEALDALMASTIKLRTAEKEGVIANQVAAYKELEHAKKVIDKQLELARIEAKSGGADKLAELAQLKAEYENAVFGIAEKMSDAKWALNDFGKALVDLKTSVVEGIKDMLLAVNNKLLYGEGSGSIADVIGESLGNMLKSIQQDFFSKTIAEPLATTITDSLFSIVGMTQPSRGIDHAMVRPDGAVKVYSDDQYGLNSSVTISAKDKTGGFFEGMLENVKNMFENLFGSEGILSGLFKGIFGPNGLLSNLLGPSLGFIGNFLFGSSAAGGPVHMAAGGSVSEFAKSNLLRDRVPTNLEPGEFVIRKAMAQNIGRPALQSLNSTGTMPNSGNVQVNIVNKGTPQSAETSAPRFDGEKYVIDIITRDLSNNGPIRKSLRAGIR